MDPAHKTLTVPNGTLNRHHYLQQQQQQQQQQAVYRECLKNHAASLGGHSLDGCGEFMASPSSDPTSLTCAACGCHRNFHRRLPLSSPPQPLLHHHHQQQQQEEDDNNNDEDDEEDGSENDRREDADGKTGNNNNSINNYINNGSVPHMLMALSTAAAAGTTAQQQRSRKRFRTRFSPEDRCREIGVGKGVFKVWMHNNKHNFVPRSPSSPSLAIPTVSAMSTLRGHSVLVNGVRNVRARGPVSRSTAS